MYLVVLIANMGGYVDQIMKAQIRDGIGLQISLDPELRRRPPEERQQLINELDGFMNDDFGTARVIANFFEMAPIINSVKGGQIAAGAVTAATLQLMRNTFKTWLEDILGLTSINENDTETVNGLMNLIIDIRKQARSDKNWAMSDQIRNKLSEIGIQLKDDKSGQVSWSM